MNVFLGFSFGRILELIGTMFLGGIFGVLLLILLVVVTISKKIRKATVGGVIQFFKRLVKRIKKRILKTKIF